MYQQPAAPWPPPASWGVRAVAWIVDGLIGASIFALIFYPGVFFSIEILDAGGKPAEDTPEMMVAFLIMLLVALFASFSYFWLMHASSGQTLGKKMMGIKAISVRTGEPPSLGASALRQFVRMLLGFVWVGALLDYLWPLWDQPYQQAIHDKAAGTRVVQVRGVAPAPMPPHYAHGYPGQVPPGRAG
ncbi:putative RDD family membrane protein YckC [Nocardiopsis mwathae]|uniref:Putative RDD family membrane protein YckC n=1 Tax=Nocardiopsis mwathae TaxID=1472723 RepID=A0A7X0D708_9ACTN|nr:RDD family protein [Nocardiopsis mwathae]MBB6173840.1 putative RDD family membrane protein YckC [Nocardiopsis mwathae]